jgi:pimeloyl-ACP methyl ester carboxylesterase
VFDHLGYGRSDQREGQDLTLAAQARRFAALLGHWGLDEPSVVANDIGGAIVCARTCSRRRATGTSRSSTP